jgi:beta-glucosidase
MTKRFDFDQAYAFGALETTEKLSEAEIDAKARALLSQLTLDEKIKMMSGDTPFWPGLVEMFNGGYNAHTWVAGEIKRLGIPGIRFSDGPRGVVMKGATTFPVSMSRGATFDPDLEERIGDIIGKEMRAMGANFYGGVCINLVRHPAWGRSQETYGEDPIVLGAFGAALARGVQNHVMACAKHYALNSMENARFTVDATIARRPLHEIYLRHFKKAVDAGVASIMSAYNSVNGEWCGQNYDLLTDILKKQWGFQGFIMTDFIFGMRDSKKAALGGQDVEMPFAMIHNRDLKGLVEAGVVPMERIDDAVFRALRQQIRFAQGRNPKDYDYSVVGCAAHRAVAREAAEKGMVLLKNEGSLLPLKGVKKVAVIGKLAAQANTGDGGSSNTQPEYVITPLQGLQEALGDAVVYDDGSDPARAAKVARGADVVIMVTGYTCLDEGEFTSPDTMTALAKNFPAPTADEMKYAQMFMGAADHKPAEQDPNALLPGGDRHFLTLRPEEEELIQTVAVANPKTVVAMMGGSSIITEAWRNQVPAILMMWYPGMEGGHAFADILLGKVNPSGKLPLVFPAKAEDLPFYEIDATAITYDLWHGYRKMEKEGCAPAFPFGFGLSYTTFRYANLRVEKDILKAGEPLVTSVEVTNTGSAAGDEVVQWYLAAPGSKVERAPRELKGFQRVSLKPGETKTVRVEIPAEDLAYYDEQLGWTVEPLTYELIAGKHSLDEEALKVKVTVR